MATQKKIAKKTAAKAPAAKAAPKAAAAKSAAKPAAKPTKPSPKISAAPIDGAPAPDFALPGSDGKTHTLADYRGKNVVLYFYPKDDTPGCTREAIAFEGAAKDLAKKMGINGTPHFLVGDKSIPGAPEDLHDQLETLVTGFRKTGCGYC